MKIYATTFWSSFWEVGIIYTTLEQIRLNSTIAIDIEPFETALVHFLAI